MKNVSFLYWILLAAILVHTAKSNPTVTEPVEDEEDDFDEDEDSSEADDDGRIYKNPRNSPSTECPRDEEQATLLGQKCLRKCSSDEDCKSKKKKCLCDGACGMSCIKPDRECPELSQPQLGSVLLSGRHFGSRGTYSCPHGYHVVGLQSRLCQADGQWAGSEPACKQNIYCLTPPTIEHARHSALPEQETFDLDSTVQYHCHTGYVTNGFPRAKCLAIDGQASWYGPDIQCEPRSCGQPPDPSNGWHAGECYTFGCRVTYHCGEGYELVGKQERYCQADGSWTPKELPICVLVTSVQCPAPENPKNGKAIYTTVTYNSVVSYECRYGYTLIGESSRRCGADRKWSGSLPICKEINCGDPGVLYNGWLENIEAGTGLGASIIFRCHPEMLLQGHSSTVCQIDGRWRYPVPECLAPCIVPSISQGQVIAIEPEVDTNSSTTVAVPVITSVGKVKHGTALEVICDEHYEFPASVLAPPTCNNGTWSIIPRCTPARCKSMPRPPKNGMVLAPKTDHGMRARFKCKDGFILIGLNGKEVTDLNEYILTCSFGNWTGDTPLCQEVYCSFPGYIPNGKVLLVGNMGLYDYRPYVKKIVNNKQIMYDCDKGYVLEEGPPGATCVGGKWRPTELPKCLPGQHPRLRWNRRRRSILRTYLQRPKSLEEEQQLRRLLLLHALLLHKRETRQKRQINQFLVNSLNAAISSTSDYNKYRPKRSINMDEAYHFHAPTKYIRKRRNTADIERAYSKYYEKIKQKYQKYVKDLLGYNQLKNKNMIPNFYSAETDFKRPTSKKIQVQDGRWYNPNKNTEFLSRYRATHKARIVNGNEYSHPEIYSNGNKLENQIQGNSNRKLSNYVNLSSNNLYGGGHSSPAINDFQKGNAMNTQLLPPHDESLSNLISKLRMEIVRKRRRRRDLSMAGGATSPIEEVTEIAMIATPTESEQRKQGKPRGPCEEIDLNTVSNITIVRPGKGPTANSPGTIIHIECNPGYKLNIRNANATARCIRGIWKPQKPVCLSAPCSVPSTEHGKYFEVGPDTVLIDPKANLRPLTPYEEIANEQVITFQCEDGYNIQGPAQLRCVHGSWSVHSFPECVPLPCVLPSIANIIYEGGYRAGLTIAHGSSVTVHCDNPANSLPIQLVCNRGNVSPSTIHCESGSRKSREEYLGEVEFIGSSDKTLSNVLTSHGLKFVNENASTLQSFSSSFAIAPNHFGSNNASNTADTDNSGRSSIYGGRDCGRPERVDNALVYKNGQESEENTEEIIYPSGTEILFNCIASVAGERNTWKIVCEDGSWIGRSFSCANGTCLFRNNEPNVVSFYNDLEIREDVVEFPPGATIISRCVDIGKYALVGSNERTCIHSEWSGQRPVCYGLNQENDYAMEKAPTILFRHQNGPIAQSNDGKLIVYPGTTVHMECLWMRRFGNPKWNVSHEYRVYPEGWVSEEGRDPQLEYRLSVFHAVEDDSGIFTCQTPARHEHSVEVVVKAINCPDIPIRRGLIISNNDTKMSSRVLLSCANGNSLIGASELFCLPSGNWSAPLPVCESVECGDIPIPLNESSPRVAVLSREVGGRAAFSCPSGYGLRGPSESICLPSGEWATPFPTCIEVQCDNPGAPQNGYAQGSAPYRAGDVVQFNCNPEYMMQGQPIIACQDNGRWSGGLPKCVQACSYPGTAISGRMSSVKFYYAIGESITFTCDSGLELRGAKMLKCLRNGKWSNAIPTCVNPNH